MEEDRHRKGGLLRRVVDFYRSGFAGMTVGRTLWAIVLIKLFILFFVLKLFFFRSDLAPYKTPQQKSGRVIERLVERGQTDAPLPSGNGENIGPVL